MMIPFSKRGCSANNQLMLNDRYLSGMEHDLSAFSCDLSAQTPVKVVVQNKEVAISIDHREVYRNTYHETMGRLVGLRFEFTGVGEVASLSLKAADGRIPL